MINYIEKSDKPAFVFFNIYKLYFVPYCHEGCLSLKNCFAHNIVLFCPRNQHTKLKLNRIIISHRNCCQTGKNNHVLNGLTDILGTILELLRFLNRT